jgi:hypothetical protein
MTDRKGKQEYQTDTEDSSMTRSEDWIEKIDMVEFAINSSVSATTGYLPFELKGGYMPNMMKEFWGTETMSKGIKEFAAQALMNVATAHNAIIEA